MIARNNEVIVIKVINRVFIEKKILVEKIDKKQVELVL